MSQNSISSDEIAVALHPVFDEQIINYGAYNLIFAKGSAIYRNPDIAEQQDANQQHFLVGYRDAPQEVIIAPLHLPEVSSAGTPTTIDNTNALRGYTLTPESFGIESTNGSSFILSPTPLIEVELTTGLGVLDQAKDLEDFMDFFNESWVM